ncbi:hypothetical protein SARC_06215 [Sphaeroforma arctica JP610]|uniref:J domain-containing protein n=1 Tax=Sphaeroforma arctica JP610 TaxID=667725 RepID=A0A0L0FX91_9EUKA|nr:hypothetical protein SARC_06215 [Sphaeroforma arctica JP610]KNC81460.1 hypothetical protein SARC_06215 [Sphaeroforma arctica JP610]|eukprot:XP_014155362.1 hypothetical protein SARC_06215 [Sphaeroforma arctica JP610]
MKSLKSSVHVLLPPNGDDSDASTISPVKPLESEPPPTIIGLFAPSSRPADSSVSLAAFEVDGNDRGSREMIGTDDTHTHIKARAADVTVEQDRASTLGRSEIGLNLLSESSRRRKNSYLSVGSEDVDLTVGLFGPQTSKPIPPRKILEGLPLETEETSGYVAKLKLDTQTEFEEPFVELTEADIFGLLQPTTVPNHRPLPETEAVNRNGKSNGSVGDTVSPEPKPAVATTDYAPPDIMQMIESDLFGTEESAQPNKQSPQSEFRNRTKTDIAHVDVSMTTSPRASPVKASGSSQRATHAVTDSAHAPMPTTSSKFYSPSSEGSGEDDSDDESAPAQHTVPPIEELTMANLGSPYHATPYHVPMQSINRACESSHTNGMEGIAATAVPAKDTLPSVAVTSKPPKLVRIPKKPAPPRLSALDMLLSSAPKVKSALASAMVKGLLDTLADSDNHSDGADDANTKQTSHSTFAGIHHEDTFSNSHKVKTEALPVVGQVFSDLIPDVGGDAFPKESNQNARNGKSQLTEREIVEEASIGIKSEPVQQPVHKSPSAHENRSLDTDGKQVVEGLTPSSIHNESTTQPKGELTHHSLNTSTPMFTTYNATTSTNTKAAKPISTSTSTQVDSTTPGPADMATAIDETSPDTSPALSTTHPTEGAVRNDGAPKIGLFVDTVPMVRAIDQSRQPNRCSGSFGSEGSEPTGLVYPPGSGLCAESLRAIGVETPCQLVINRIVRFQELRVEDRVCSFVLSRMSKASRESKRDAVRLYNEAIEHMVDNTKRMGGGSCVSHLPLKISAKDVDQLHPRCATSRPQRTDRREDADVLSQLYTKRAICLDALKYHIKAEADCVEALICDSENLECMLAYARMQMNRGVISQVDLSLSRVQDVLDKQTAPSHEHSFSDELHTLTAIVDKLKAMYLIIKAQYEPNLEGHDPDSAESSTQYSATLVRAIKMLQSRCPRSVNCQLWYARYLRLGLGDLEAATTLLTEVYESDPMTGKIPLVSELSLCAYENADFETVIVIVDDTVLQGTSDSSKIDKATKMTIGQLRVGMQQRLQKSIVLCHRRREGKLAFNRGDYVDAAENYTKASELTEPYHPTNMAICLNNKAMCLMQRAKIFKKRRQPKIALTRLKEAMACCDKALVLKYNFAKSIIRKAGVYTLLGDFADNLTTRIRQYKNAKEVYEDVLPMQPNNQEIRERFLLLEEKLKKANSEKRIQDERSKREQEIEEERIRDELHRAEAARGQRKSSRKKLDGAHITQSLYEVLNVPPTATTEDIKKAYKTLARTHHPDKNEDGNPERFQEIVGAHATLADPSKRKEYDHSLIGTGLNKRSGISRQFGSKR